MRSQRLLPAIAIFLLGLTYFGMFVDYGLNFDDEGTMIYQIERVADGQHPYTDFHMGYTPAVYYLHAWVMKTFGYSVIPGRWLLAVTNSLSMALLFWVTLQVAPLWVAWLAPVLFASSIQIHAGDFAAFNIPYPVWYNLLLFTTSLLATIRFAETGRMRWLVVAGALAGIDFAFKPNAGLLNIAALGFCVISLFPAVRGGVPRWQRNLELCWWWMFCLATSAGIFALFSGGGGIREFLIFGLPIAAAALFAGWRSMVAPVGPIRGSVVTASISVGVPFVAINAPWLYAVWKALGTERFLVDVFFIGAHFEKFYYRNYPMHIPNLVPLIVIALALPFLPRLLAAWRIRVDYACAVATVGAVLGLSYIASHSVMPEGFSAAISSEVEIGVFVLVPVLEWLGLFVWARTIGVSETERLASARWGIVMIGAILMYVQVYPRTDYTHWVTAAPLALCVGAALIARLTRLWTAVLPRYGRLIVQASFVLPLLGLVVIRAYPDITSLYSFERGWPQRLLQYQMTNSRAPIRINLGRAVSYDSAVRMAQLIQDKTDPDEKVFTFPSLDFMSFLSDRHNPTRHGYFYPRWPGHDWEAEVVAQLMAEPPRFVVVLHGHSAFFVQAPIFYYAISDFLDREYRPYALIGQYMLLAHRGLVPPSKLITESHGIGEYLDDTAARDVVNAATKAPDADARVTALRKLESLKLEATTAQLRSLLSDPDVRIRNHAVAAFRLARDPATTRALASAAVSGRISVGARTLALRTVAAAGDDSAVAPLLAGLLSPDPQVADGCATALMFISSRTLAKEFWAGGAGVAAVSVPFEIPPKRRLRRYLLDAINNPLADRRVRLAAIMLAVAMPRDEAGPVLKRAFEEGDLGVSTRAGLELLHQDQPVTLTKRAIDQIVYDDMLAPRLIHDAARLGQRRVLVDALSAGSPKVRDDLAWIAASVGGRSVVRALAKRLHDADPQVRMAALWGLQRSGALSHLGAVAKLQYDRDYRVRAFAERALTYLRSISTKAATTEAG